jgi:long-chain acyl-CoA synthetase
MSGLAQLLPRAARRFGVKPALISSNRVLSFTELDQLSGLVADSLAKRGLVAGDRVSLYSENRWEWLVAYHGILKAGLVVNPLNVMLVPEEVCYVINDSSIAAIIGTGERLGPIAARASELPTLCTSIAFDGGTAGCESFDDLLAERVAPPPLTDPVSSLGSIGYTSGTTGYPKGAMQPHRALLLNPALTATMHCRHDGDLLLTALPAAHVYGNAAIHATLMAGGTVVLQERFDAGAMLALAEQHRATMIEGVPAMYAALLAHEDVGRRDLSSLTRCTVGGQTIPVETIRAWEEVSGGPLIELWGMTEIAGLGTTHAFYAPLIRGSIGVALPGVELRVADLDDYQRPLDPGQAGELMVRGPIVMEGYWGNQEATDEVLEKDGWLHTGDVATADRDGHFYIVDRRKDMIITGGYNVYPAEIERVINSHPAVSIVAVGKRPDPVKGELACAYVVRKPGATVTEDELLTHCQAHLAAYKVPRRLRFVDDLPKTSTGKILRRELGSLNV